MFERCCLLEYFFEGKGETKLIILARKTFYEQTPMHLSSLFVKSDFKYNLRKLTFVLYYPKLERII